jgi:hypothetical protein
MNQMKLKLISKKRIIIRLSRRAKVPIQPVHLRHRKSASTPLNAIEFDDLHLQLSFLHFANSFNGEILQKFKRRKKK